MNSDTLDRRRCARCTAVIHPGSNEGLCPACLLEFALGGEDVPTESLGPEEPVPLLRRLGEFELVHRLGRGGMGVVYKARQARLQRCVALKLIQSGGHAGPEFLERFRIEARAAAGLDHPGIVSVFESGEIEGQAYLAMRLVEGQSLDLRAAVAPFSPVAAARLLVQIAGAVHYAHQRGVLHRDLKPANVLIDEQGQPHLTDFGLARIIDHDSTVTSTLATLGTPAYMAPEQAAGGTARVTVAADVYGLGAILFEALTGQPPFSGATPYETVRQVLEVEAKPPSLLDSRIPADLDTICLKCLAKDPRQRYQTAQEFASDLQRWLNHEPILARPATTLERVAKWTRRKPALSALIAVSFLASVVFLWERSRAAEQLRQERDHSVRQQERAEAVSTRLLFEEADRQLQAGRPSQALALFAHLVREFPNNHIAGCRIVSLLSHQNFALPLQATAVSPQELMSVELSPDGEKALVACRDGSVAWIDWRSGQILRRLLGAEGALLQARLNRQGDRLVTVGDEGLARIWDAQDGSLRQTLRADAHGTVCADFSPDGRWLLTCGGEGQVKIWDLASGTVHRRLWDERLVSQARFSPTGDRVAAVSHTDGRLAVWDLSQPQQPPRVVQLPSELTVVRWSPDGAFIAAQVAAFETIGLIDAATLQTVVGPFRHTAPITSVAFTGDRRLLATTSEDGTARVWDLGGGRAFTEPLIHPAAVLDARFTADGKGLLTVCQDGVARHWDVQEGRALTPAMQHPEPILHAGLSPDGSAVVTVAQDQRVRVWDADTSQLKFPPIPFDYPLHSAYFSPDSQQLAVLAGARFVGELELWEGNAATVWDARSGRAIAGPWSHEGRLVSALFRPGAKDVQLITCGFEGTVKAWDLRDPVEPRWMLPAVSTGRRPEIINSAQLSPDGSQLLLAKESGTAEIWSVSPLQLRTRLPQPRLARWAEFSPIGHLALTTSDDRTTRVWDLDQPSDRPLAILNHDHFVLGGHFTADGRQVVTFSVDRTARRWDARSGRLLTEPLRHDEQVWSAFSSPDGSKTITITWTGAVRLWDAETGLPLSEPLGGGIWKKPFISLPDRARMTADGERVLCLFADRSARLLELPRVSGPAPAWLAELAEAIAGQALDADRRPKPVPWGQLLRLRERLSPASAPNTGWEIWARWFFAPREQRTLSAWSARKPTDFLPGAESRAIPLP